MALVVNDEATAAAVRDLAKRKNKGIAETIREAIDNERARLDDAGPFMDRIRTLQARFARFPETGMAADKDFFDRLSGEP